MAETPSFKANQVLRRTIQTLSIPSYVGTFATVLIFPRYFGFSSDTKLATTDSVAIPVPRPYKAYRITPMRSSA